MIDLVESLRKKNTVINKPKLKACRERAELDRAIFNRQTTADWIFLSKTFSVKKIANDFG